MAVVLGDSMFIHTKYIILIANPKNSTKGLKNDLGMYGFQLYHRSYWGKNKNKNSTPKLLNHTGTVVADWNHTGKADAAEVNVYLYSGNGAQSNRAPAKGLRCVQTNSSMHSAFDFAILVQKRCIFTLFEFSSVKLVHQSCKQLQTALNSTVLLIPDAIRSWMRRLQFSRCVILARRLCFDHWHLFLCLRQLCGLIISR